MIFALPVAAKVAGGFIAKHWQAFAAVLLVLMLMLLAAGMSASYVERGWRAKMGEAQAAWNLRVAEAEKKAREAEARERMKETAWRDHVAKREKEYRDDVKTRDAARAAERLAGDRLRSALDAFVRAGYSGADPSGACGDLRSRIATLGSLLQEVDGLAGESAGAADRTRDSLALCRGYIESLKQTR